MTKDLFIIDTRCHLNVAVKKAFERKGYEVEVSKHNFIANKMFLESELQM